MAALNALIAQGGTNIASPIQKYMGVRKDMLAERRNALAESQVKQGMQHAQENQISAKQDRDMKISAAYLRAVLASPNPELAYTEATQQLEAKTGIKSPPTFNKQQVQGLVDHVYGRETGKRVNMLSPEGATVPGIERETGRVVRPGTNEYLDDYTKAPTRATTVAADSHSGLIKDTAKDKDTVKAMEAEEGLRNLGANINRIKDTLNASPDYVGGVSGTIIQMVNSGQMQFDQLLGRRDPLADAQGNIDSKQLGNLSKENIGWVRKAAIEGKRADSAILELAFTHAKILNNSGKISDADIRYARDIIEGGADKATKIDSLNNLLERGYSNYTKQRETRKGRGNLQENWKDISRDEIFGVGFQPVGQASAKDVSDADAAATEALKAMGL